MTRMNNLTVNEPQTAKSEEIEEIGKQLWI